MRLIGLTFVTTLALAACGTSTVPASSAAPASPATSSAAFASVGPSKPAASAPAASAKPASAKPAASAAATAGGSIKVGVIEPLTGTLSPNGKDGRDGFDLYLQSVNSTVAGRRIQVIEADSQGQADMGLAKAKQLVESNGVKVLTGFVATPVCYAVAGYVKQAHVPMMVNTNCAAQDLTTNPKFASPYLSRFSNISLSEGDPAAAWAYGAGYRKAIIMTADYAPGLQVSDLFSSAFISHGGTIVQELHPPLGTNDFGPYLAQLNPAADLLAIFEPGADALRFGTQYADYAGHGKRQVLDLTGVLTGAELNQLGTKTLGFIGNTDFNINSGAAVNVKFLKAWRAKHRRDPSAEAVGGYGGAQALVAAIQKVNGNIDNQLQFLAAIDATKIDTPKGPVSLDDHHDIVEDKYIVRIVKDGSRMGLKVLKTYPAVGQNWDRTQRQLLNFKAGQHKGQWVGMTKAKLGEVLTPPKS